MTYLIWQLLTCLLLAAVFGLLLGWLLWGALARRLRHQSLESQLQAKKLGDLPGKFEDLQTQHSALLAAKESEAAKFTLQHDESKQALAAKDSELDKLRMSILDNDSLHRTDLSKKDAYAATLSARVAELEPVAAQASAASAKCQDELQIRDGKITELETKLRAVSLQHGSAVERIGVLEPIAARVPSLEAEVAAHTQAHAGKDQQILDLAGKLVEVAPLAAMVPVLKESVGAHEAHIAELQSSLAAKDAKIAEHVEAHSAKDHQIAELTRLSTTVPTLKETVAAHEAHIAELQSTLAARQAEVAEHAEVHASKDRHIADLAGHVVELGSLAAAVHR